MAALRPRHLRHVRTAVSAGSIHTRTISRLAGSLNRSVVGIQPGPGRSTWAWRRLLLLARGGRALVGPHRQAGDGGGGLVGVHRPQHDRGPAVQFGVVQVAARVVLAEESDNPVPVRSPAVAAAPGPTAGPREGGPRLSHRPRDGSAARSGSGWASDDRHSVCPYFSELLAELGRVDGGKLLYGPSGTCDIAADFEPGYHLAPGDNAVNAGLRATGMRAADGSDEYETARLSRHRMIGDWLTG